MDRKELAVFLAGLQQGDRPTLASLVESVMSLVAISRGKGQAEMEGENTMVASRLA